MNILIPSTHQIIVSNRPNPFMLHALINANEYVHMKRFHMDLPLDSTSHQHRTKTKVAPTRVANIYSKLYRIQFISGAPHDVGSTRIRKTTLRLNSNEFMAALMRFLNSFSTWTHSAWNLPSNESRQLDQLLLFSRLFNCHPAKFISNTTTEKRRQEYGRVHFSSLFATRAASSSCMSSFK